MVSVTVTGGGDRAPQRRRGIASVTLDEIKHLQESQVLDFKREVELDKPELKFRLVDDVVAFLNRGQSRIIVGVVEKQGRFDRFWPMNGDADKMALRVQTLIQDTIVPVPADVQVVPVPLEDGFILDIQIPHHRGGPFMNRQTGSYLVRSGARNLPIDPGALRSTFVDEQAWMTRLDELTAVEDARLAESGRLVTGRVLRIGVLPREHFDYRREPFVQNDDVRSWAPHFHESFRDYFKICEDGHEALSIDMREQGIERLFVRDDWFVHFQSAFAIGITQGEGRLGLYEFNQDLERFLAELAAFFADEQIVGPFAITLALQSLYDDERMKVFFPRGAAIRTLRPLFVDAVDDPELIAGFKRRVQQATVWS
jgi:hypothetical protein